MRFITLNLSSLFLFIGMLPVLLSSQPAELDSLKQLLTTDAPDSTKIWAYTQLIWPNTKSNIRYALELTADMMEIGRKAKQERWIRQAQYYYGVTYKNVGDLSKALPYIDSVYYQSGVMKDTSFMAYSSYQKAVILKDMGLLEDAIEWFNITIAWYQHINNTASVAMSLNGKAGLYRQMKLYDRAISTYEEAYQIYFALSDSIGLSHVYNNLGNVYSEMDSFQLALEYYGMQEELDLARNDVSGLGFCYENRGRLFEKMGRLDEAIVSLRKSLEIRRGLDHRQLLANTLFELGSSLQKKGQIEEAEQLIEEGLTIAESQEMIEQLRQGYLALSQIYNEKGDFKKAYELRVKQAAFKDSLLNSTISEQALRIDALTDYDARQREQQINLLAAQNEIQHLRLERSRTILMLALFGMLALAGLLIWISRSKARIKKLYGQLETQQEVISKSLQEKEFLLKEIHHRVKNNLQVISSLLKLQSRSISDKMAQQALDEGRHRVRSMALIHQNLYQDEHNLTSINVNGYLDQLTSGLMSSYKVNRDQVQLILKVDDLILDVDSVIPIGLIVNELVSNTFKHAFPEGREGEIVIKLHQAEENILRLEVVDDGVGYEEKEISSQSFGHRLIKALSERLKADYQITGDKGTRAVFLIKNYQIAA